MTYRHLVNAEMVLGEEREVRVVLTHCPLRLWRASFGTVRQWLLSAHREKGYAHVSVMGFELSVAEVDDVS